MLEIRPAAESDLAQIRDIYNHSVEAGTATLDWDKKSIAEFRAWLTEHERHPRWAARVATRGGEVAGWSALSPFAARRGYRASAELSIYVASGAKGAGVGTALCADITDYGRAAGLASIVGLATSTNVVSMRMLERQGYRRCGEWRSIGYKQGSLIGLVLWEIEFEENRDRYLNGDMDDVFLS